MSTDLVDRWFVSTDWLARHLDDPRVVVVDGSWHLAVTGRNARREYEAAHIPGAVFFDIDAIADLSNPLPHMLPTPVDFAAAAGALGIDDVQEIVIYDVLGLYAAPRVWWTFRVMGARDVVLLDGGLPKWQAEGRTVDATVVTRPQRTFRAQFAEGSVFDLAAVREGLAEQSIQLVDARPPARFWGEAPEPRPWVKSGRIPGSFNLPMTSLIDNGRLRPAAELRQAFERAGIDLQKPIVTSCGSGVNAATLNLALDTIGVQRVGLYDGSWTEWGARDDMPIAVGRPTES
jgi:thiosulfate/3-mercaptopyruvate sulfurtransferase